MHQRDLQRFAFLYLCGSRDRDILLGKEEITFSDLERFLYLTDFFGLECYNQEIWNEHSGRFTKQFQYLEKLYDENCGMASWEPTEDDDCLRETWLKEFCRQVPDDMDRRRLENIVNQICRDKGFDVCS